MSSIPLQSESLAIWKQKYQLKDHDGTPIDHSIKETFRRVAKALAAVEATDELREQWEARFYQAMCDGAIPAGRILSNAGAGEYKKETSLINCCVSNLIHDSINGIMTGLHEAALSLKVGNGIGYDFSTLRPRGGFIAGAGARTSGALSFMDIYDKMCFSIASAGGRRGAQMAAMTVSHPDILEFITAKREEGRFRQFNCSVLITDAFMHSVAHNEVWPLAFPMTQHEITMTGVDLDDQTQVIWMEWPIHNDYLVKDNRVACRIYKTVNAKDLWDTILRSTYEFSEPGIMFIDRINRLNNNHWCEDIRTSNPCFTGDTLVWTDRGSIPFKTLAESGSDVNVLTEVEGKLVYRVMRNPRKTQQNAALVKVEFSNGTHVVCTPNHVFYLKNGQGVEAKDLTCNMRIESVYRYKANQKGYKRVVNGKHTPLEHHVPFGDIPVGYDVHHINGDKADNRIENLEIILQSEHRSMHMTGDQNPMRRFPEKNWLIRQDHSGKNNGRFLHHLDEVKIVQLRQSGLSYQAIANEMGCSKKAISKRILMQNTSNHAVLSVVNLDYKEDVYCGTVDEVGRFFVAVGENDGVLVSNCGEVPLPPYGSCLLGSINLTQFVVNPFQDHAYFDWPKYERTIAVFTRMLDNVVEISGLILEGQRKEIASKRRHGMGYFGLGSAMTLLKIRYGSPASLQFTNRVTRTLALIGWKQALELSKEKGPAPILNGFTRLTPELKQKYPTISEQEWAEWAGDTEWISNKILHTRCSPYMQRIGEIDSHLIEELCIHGARFTHHTAIAPTGTLALSVGNNASNGIEPSFSHSYKRNVIKEGKKTKEQMDVYAYEYLARLECKPPVSAFEEYFVTANDLTPKEHIDVQSEAQYWVDQSISKCVAEGTPIITNRGILSIDQLGDACVAGSFGNSLHGLKVLSNDGNWHNVLSHYYAGECQTIRIFLSNGQIIEGSPQHKLMNLNEKWTKLSDMKVGDCVLSYIPQSIEFVGGEPLHTEYAIKNERKITIPCKMSPDLALWIGMWLADGSINNHSVNFCNSNNEIIDKWMHLSMSLFGKVGGIIYDQRNDVKSIGISSNGLVRWLRLWLGKNAASKKVPDQILRGSKQEMMSFLSGISLDGYIINNQGIVSTCLYCGKSKKIADAIFSICSVLGYSPRRGSKDVNGYDYNVYFVSVKGFQNCLEDRKNSPITEDRRYLVPVPLHVKSLKPKIGNPCYNTWRGINQRKAKTMRPNTLEAVGYYCDPTIEAVKINRIEAGIQRLFDIEVEDTHSYLIDGIISHNTVNCPSDMSFDDFKGVYQYAYDKGLKGVATFRFNPVVFQGVLVNESDLDKTTYRFVLDTGEVIDAKGNEQIDYDGEIHTAANLYDAINEGYYGKH